jgi:protein gp37
MGENSAISWTRHTWNPWIGCAKVSPACDGCSAEALMDKHYGPLQVKGGQWPTDKPGFCRINLYGERADDGWPMKRVGRSSRDCPRW